MPVIRSRVSYGAPAAGRASAIRSVDGARGRRGARNTRTADDRLRVAGEHDPLVLPMPSERAALLDVHAGAMSVDVERFGHWSTRARTPLIPGDQELVEALVVREVDPLLGTFQLLK